MSGLELLQSLRLDEGYLEEVFVTMIVPIRNRILEILGFEFRPFQTEFSDMLIKETLRARNKEMAIIVSRQAGKTEATATTVLTLIIFHLTLGVNFSIGWFAPARSTSIMVARKRIIEQAKLIKDFMDSCDIELVKGYGRERVGRTSPLLIFRNTVLDVEASIRSLSANPKSNIKGDTLDLVIIEDSQEVDENKMHNDIFPMSSKGAPIFMSGVPIPDVTKMNKYYIETVTKNPRNAWLSTVDWKRACGFHQEELVEIGAWEDGVDSEYTEEIEAYENGSEKYRFYLDNYRDHVLKMRKRLLKNNPEAFLSQYELKWFSDLSAKLIGMEQIMDLEQDYTPNRERLRFWGLDIAKINDSTAGVVLERYLGEHHIIGLFQQYGINYPQQANEWLEFLKRFTPLRYGFLDATGGGDMFMDLFKKELYAESDEVRKGIGSFDGINFSNREDVNEMNQQLCMDLRQKRIHYSKKNVDVKNLNVFMEELDATNRVYRGHYLWLQAPDQKGLHDDFPTALSLARFASKEKSQKIGVLQIDI